MENKEYLNEICYYFKEYNDMLENKLNNINSTRKVTEYPELTSSFYKAFNSCVNCIKYLSKNKIDYINDITINDDKIALIAWENYVLKHFTESIKEIDKLEKFIKNKIQEISNSPEIKARKWKIKLYNKMVIANPNLMRMLYPITKNIPSIKKIDLHDEFRDGIKYMDNYKDISEKIIDLNPDEELINAFLFYLEILHKSNKIEQTNENKIEIWKRDQIQLKLAYNCMLKVLLKLNKIDDTYKLTECYLNYLKENELEIQNYFKNKYNKFKKKNTIKTKKLKK